MQHRVSLPQLVQVTWAQPTETRSRFAQGLWQVGASQIFNINQLLCSNTLFHPYHNSAAVDLPNAKLKFISGRTGAAFGRGLEASLWLLAPIQGHVGCSGEADICGP